MNWFEFHYVDFGLKWPDGSNMTNLDGVGFLLDWLLNRWAGKPAAQIKYGRLEKDPRANV